VQSTHFACPRGASKHRHVLSGQAGATLVRILISQGARLFPIKRFYDQTNLVLTLSDRYNFCPNVCAETQAHETNMAENESVAAEVTERITNFLKESVDADDERDWALAHKTEEEALKIFVKFVNDNPHSEDAAKSNLASMLVKHIDAVEAKGATRWWA
tara:strand:+ start:617 stop:1093 length:477 start_codon:yes stop_codon:yes gene_type:complete